MADYEIKDFGSIDASIEEILRHAKGTRPDVAVALWKMLEDSGDQAPKVLRRIAELYDDIESDDSVSVPPTFNEAVIKNLKQQDAKLIDAFLSSAIAENSPEDNLYASVWSFINNPIFTTELRRAFALYWILIDPQIPYFQLPVSTEQMGNEKYHDKLKTLGLPIKKIRLALHRNYAQRTEQADVVLGLVLAQADNADRVVLMSVIISLCKTLGSREPRSESAR